MKFGDNVSTTIMAPLERTPDRSLPAIMKLSMTAIRPNFLNEAKPGMVIVAGKNWGFGSHREQANSIFKELGFRAMVAESISRIYYRNSIAIGMPAIACKGVSDAFEEGDTIEIDLSNGLISNRTKGLALETEPMSAEMLDILSKGGILEVLKQELGNSSEGSK